MEGFDKEIRAYALKNAIEFGKADAGKILPKLFQHGLDRKDIGKIMPEVQKIVKEINSMSESEREKSFSGLKELVKEREEKEKTLPTLKNVEGKVVTRIPPEPSKHLHVGHAISFLINAYYAEKNNGECILRFDDANPEKVNKDFVKSILDDITNYLEIKPDKIVYVSNDIPKLYKYAETLIEKNSAYVCFCDRETMQNLRHEGKACKCRDSDVNKNLEEWKNLLKGKYSEGVAVLRFKGDMKSNNQVMRDPVLFRIKGDGKLWPLYDFYTPIEDSTLGVTHILRTVEFDLRVELHQKIQEILGLKKQEIVQYGRISVVGEGVDSKKAIQGRDLRAKIESGEYSGWDDIRLMTVKSLKRRGITLEVLKELIQQVGLSKKAVKIDFAALASISRRLLDKKVDRYYFVSNPKGFEISKIKNFPEVDSVEVKIHPDKSEKRKIKIDKEIFISEEDYEKNKGKEVRLMNLCNLKILGSKDVECTGTENKNVQKIQWVSSYLKVKVLMDNAEWLSGFAESEVSKLKVGDVVQFERFGFVKLDKKPISKSGTYEFWFTHK